MMSDQSTETTLSESADAQVETPTAEVETPVTAEPTPTVNETEEILQGLASQMEDSFLETKEPDTTEKPEETSPTDGDAEGEDLSEDYDPDELFKEAKGETKAEVNEVEVLKQTVASLQSQLQQVLSSPNSPSGGQTTTTPQDTGKRPYQILPIVSAEEYEQAMESPEAFNILLNRTLYTGLELGQQESSRKAVEAAVSILTTQRAIDQYLNANPDLKPHEKLMSLTWQDIATAEPTLDFSKQLEKAGSEARRLLKLRAQKRGQLKQPNGKPQQRGAFTNPKGGTQRQGQRPQPEGGARGWDW